MAGGGSKVIHFELQRFIIGPELFQNVAGGQQNGGVGRQWGVLK